MRIFLHIIIISISLILSSCDENKKITEKIDLAQFYYEQGNYQQSISIADIELKKDSSNLTAHILLGEIYNELEYFKRSEVNFKFAIQQGCKLKKCQLGYLEALIGGKKFDEALDYKKNITQVDEEILKVQEAKIVAYKDRNVELALKILDGIYTPLARSTKLEILFLNKNFLEIFESRDDKIDYSHDELLIFAKTNYLLNNFKKAEDDLLNLRFKDKVDIISRRKIEAVELLVKVNIALNKFVEAEAIYSAFLSNNKNTGYAIVNETIKNIKSANYSKAIVNLQNLASENPTHLQTNALLAIAYFGEKNYSRVIKSLEPFRSELNSRHKSLLAKAYMSLGRYNDAISLIGESPQDEILIIDLARSKLKLGLKKQAKNLIDKIILDEKNIISNEFLAEVYFLNNDFKKLIDVFSELSNQTNKTNLFVVKSYLKLNQDSTAWNYVKKLDEISRTELSGYIANQKKEYPNALKYYSKLLTLRQEKNDYLLLTTIHLKTNQTSLAVKTLKNGFNLPGNNQKIFQLAELILNSKEKSDVIQWLSSVDRTHKDFVLAQMILATNSLRNKDSLEGTSRLKDLIKENKSLDKVYYLLAIANKKDINTYENYLNNSLAAEFNLPAAKLLYQKYLEFNEIDKVTNLLASMEESFGVNQISAPYLAKGYLKVGNPNRAFILATKMIEMGMVVIGTELLGDIHAYKNELDESLIQYRKILAKTHIANIYLKYLKVLMVQNKKGLLSIIADGEKVLREHKDDENLRFFIATFYLQKDDSRALKHLKYLNKNSMKLKSSPVFLNNFAWALLKTDPERAVKVSKQAIGLRPESIEMNDTYIEALFLNGEKDKAYEVLNRLLVMYPQDSLLLSRKKELGL